MLHHIPVGYQTTSSQFNQFAPLRLRGHEASPVLARSWVYSVIGLIFSTHLAACDAGVEFGDEEGLELQANALVIEHSQSSADVTVIDRLSIDLSTVRVDSHRGLGKEEVVFSAYIYAGGSFTPHVFWGPGKASFIKRVNEGYVHTFNRSLEVDVKRMPGACFGFLVAGVEGALSFADEIPYCWDDTRKTWKNTRDGKGIEESQTTQYSDGRFKMTLNWKLAWHGTTMQGIVNERLSGDQPDGLEWHHLDPITWAKPGQAVRVEMSPGNQGDPDLYVSYNGRPSYDRYNCRPYAGGSTPEVCETLNTPLHVSVRNYSTGVESPYSVTITPTDIGTWSAWLDRDDPGGNGDGEHLSLFDVSQVGCTTPVSIRCRRVSDKAHWALTIPFGGDIVTAYSCHYALGGICEHTKMPGGCADYEVQFMCKFP